MDLTTALEIWKSTSWSILRLRNHEECIFNLSLCKFNAYTSVSISAHLSIYYCASLQYVLANINKAEHLVTLCRIQPNLHIKKTTTNERVYSFVNKPNFQKHHLDNSHTKLLVLSTGSYTHLFRLTQNNNSSFCE